MKHFGLCYIYKILFISLSGLVEALYQLICIVHIKYHIYRHGKCSGSHRRLFTAVSHFAYFYFPKNCGHKTFKDFYNIDTLPMNEYYIFSNISQLGERSPTEGDDLYSLIYVWIVIDSLLLIASLSLLMICFYSKAIHLRVCKYIIFAWIAVAALVIIVDINIVVILIFIVDNSKSVSSWIRSIGYSEAEARKFKVFDSIQDEDIYDVMSYMPKRFMWISLRHIITVPAFVVFIGILLADTIKIYKKISKENKLKPVEVVEVVENPNVDTENPQVLLD